MRQHLLLHKLLRTFCRQWLLALALLATLNVGAEGVVARTSGGDTWQEEVLLHDGQTIVIERSQTYGGRGEIGQDAPVADHTVRFTSPKGQQYYVWNSPFDREIGRTSLRLLAVHVKDDVAYVVTEPNLCPSYNKWGRPNPPYVLFQWQTNGWQRIGIEALPQVFSTMNVSQRLARMWAKDRNGTTLTAAQIQTENTTNQPQYRSILREPMSNGGNSCEETFPNGKGRALDAGWFKFSKDMSSCKKTCQRYEYDSNSCPCNKFFKED